MKVKILTGMMFTAYFEALYDEKRKPSAVTSCLVLADNVEAAIAKIHAAYPGQAINSVFTKEHYGDRRPIEKLVY